MRRTSRDAMLSTALTGVFQIEKFIQLWGNSTCQEVSVDWLPCV